MLTSCFNCLFEEPRDGGGGFLCGFARESDAGVLLAGQTVGVGDDGRLAPFAGQPERQGGAQGEEAGEVEVLRAAGEELRVAVVEEFAKAETSGVDRGTVNRVAGDGAGG